ncbi:MAG: hypothetical protein ACXWV0_03690 [Flavisolibacter sp.]
MRKLLILAILFTTVFMSASAQQGDNAQRLERYKERVKPMLVEQAKITEAQADKVITIHFGYAGRLREVAKLGEADKTKMTEELNAAERKEYTAIPLTETQIKAVNTFFENQRKEMAKRRQDNN